jgi:hypothetical protein
MEQLQHREDLVEPSDLVEEQTHPLPRGGTDLIAFEQTTNGGEITWSNYVERL